MPVSTVRAYASRSRQRPALQYPAKRPLMSAATQGKRGSRRSQTAGEVRQAVGRGRPWNTGNDQAEQGKLFQNLTSNARRLDVLILSSYQLDAILPDQLTGERADLEDVLTTAAVQLRRAGQLVTLTALHTKTGISARQIRERFNRVKLRSEGEFITLNLALNSSPALNLIQKLVLKAIAKDDPTRDFSTSPLNRRGPPLENP